MKSKIVTRLMGGLGNQMFQYAFGRSLSENNKMELKLDTVSGFKDDYYGRKYVLNKFNIVENIAEAKDIPYLFFSHTEAATLLGKFKRTANFLVENINSAIIREKDFEKDGGLSYQANKYYFIGFWQKEDYFKLIRTSLLKEFTLKYPFNDMSKLLADQIVKTNSVAVHFRNYGYHNNKYLFQRPDIHGVLSEVYYHNALKTILQRVEDPHLFIFSDTAGVLLKNFQFTIPYTPVTHNIHSSHEDLLLMSICKHQIIANSSFSWWAAWLNQNPAKTIIAPKIWFLDKYRNENNDIIPENWIKM